MTDWREGPMLTQECYGHSTDVVSFVKTWSFSPTSPSKGPASVRQASCAITVLRLFPQGV